jgi:hypothetical protein
VIVGNLSLSFHVDSTYVLLLSTFRSLVRQTKHSSALMPYPTGSDMAWGKPHDVHETVVWLSRVMKLSYHLHGNGQGGSSFASAWMELGFVHENTLNSIAMHAGIFAQGGCVDMD